MVIKGFSSILELARWKYSAQTLTGRCFLISCLLRVSVPFWSSSVGIAVRKQPWAYAFLLAGY